MITLDTVVAFAVRDATVMDQLGQALRSDLVLANPFYRQIVEFADEFLLQRRKLPGAGDWEMWLEGLQEGMQRDGCREALGRLSMVNLSGYDAAYFSQQALEHLQQGAAQVARARMNELPQVTPEVFTTLAEKLVSIRDSSLQGLARLNDLDTWVHPVREDDLIGTGYPTLDRLIGGWGKELWITFADSGVGKSMLLQNFATNMALRGSRVLHITLEIGLGPQIRRYYRQIAQVTQGEFADEDEVKRRLRQWLRLAKGEVLLLEYPAYSITTDDVSRTIERVNRTVGQVDVLVLDYLDLLSPKKRGGRTGAYEDLGFLTHETRAFCPGFDLTVHTATQAVRRPEKKGRLTTRDMGDSYKKVQGADGLISLVQTPEEFEMHQGRLGLLKVRDSGGRGKEISLYINPELSVIQELNHPNTLELMRRLGHLPTPAAATPPAPAPAPPPTLTSVK